MAKINVLVSANLKDRLGHPRFSVEAKTVLAALDVMAANEQYGAAFRAEVYEPGLAVKPYCIFMLNGQVLDSKKLGKSPLKDGDLLHILAPVGGG